jgi:tRNA dimethylallyltransferase
LASPSLIRPKIIAVVGPTASGKTELALALARRLDGEIVSADMGQLYRELDAGTAKPPGRWEGSGEGRVFVSNSIPTHMVDRLDPSEPTSAGLYAAEARPALEAILRRGKRAIVAGGTGLYVRALIDGLDPLPPADPALRKRLSGMDPRSLHAELSRRDPQAAARIPPGNARRLARALEILEITKMTASSQWTRAQRPPGEALYLGVNWESSRLLERIRRRAQAMFPAMLSEVARLVPARFSGLEPGFRCLGYPEALAVRRGEMSPEDGLERMIRSTAAYAKRQRTWFRNQVFVRWIEPGADVDLLSRELA